jgi:DNA-binding LacI/PurR family transcriptional regulator
MSTAAPLPDHLIGQPLWAQVVHRITSDVAAGRWKVGEHLPARPALADHYGVALKTVNRAMATLIADGVLGATSRVATYVPAPGERSLRRSLQAPTDPGQERPAPTPSGSLSLAGKRLLVLAPLIEGNAWQERTTTTAQVSDPWTEAILHQAEAEAGQLGGHLICVPVWPADVTAFDAALAKALAEHRPDAVAVINLFAGDDAWTKACARRLDVLTTPCLLLSTTEAPATFPHLTYDQRHAGFYAARHLLTSGYQQVLYLDLGDAPWVADRQAGARDACRSGFAAVRPPDFGAITRLQGDDRSPARRAIAACLAAAEADGTLRWDGSTGLIAPADEFALLALDLIAARGCTPGRDLGVVGFDDLATGRHRGLSTVRPPLSSYGRELVQVLARGLAHGPELHQRRLTPELVARASTMRRQEASA